MPALVAALCGALLAVAAAGAQYALEEEFDREYGMDLFQLSYDRDWERIWAGSDRGVRLAMGSLNVRQWYLDQEVKFAADFTDRFRFIYRYDRYEGLEPLYDERQWNEFELEFGVWRWFRLGLRAQPAFWKRDADAGATAKFRYDRGRYVEVGWTALDFDNNYSFRRSQYDEGYEEIYRRPPRRWEFAGAWTLPGGFGVKAEGFRRAPSEKFYDYFYGQQPARARRYAERHGAAEVWKTLPANLEAYYAAEVDGWEETERFTAPAANPAPAAGDYDARLALDSHALGLYYQPPGRHRLRAGARRRGQARRFRFTTLPYDSYLYENEEIIYHLLWRLRTWRELYVETGYAGELVRVDNTNLGNGYAETSRWAENRVPVALEYKFGENYAFKISSGVDLDERDWGQYLIYDKAYAFVIACF
jgi:hypothetical protein